VRDLVSRFAEAKFVGMEDFGARGPNDARSLLA